MILNPPVCWLSPPSCLEVMDVDALQAYYRRELNQDHLLEQKFGKLKVKCTDCGTVLSHMHVVYWGNDCKECGGLLLELPQKEETS